MIVVDIVLAFCVAILFAVFVKQCVRIERCEDNMGMSEAEIQELRRRCDAYRALIEALSKSVRELNGVVEAAVKVKEETSDNKPDTKALIGGWDADEVDEPELVSVEEFKKNIVDICVNGTCEQKQDLIDAWTLQSALLSQQCNYQTLQSDLLSQTQQCIYPWQSGQLQSSAMLPLWYINRRLEDM